MDLVSSHHLLLLGELPHQLSHVGQGHVRCVGLRCVYDALDLVVNVLKRLEEVHVSEKHPELILVIDKDGLVVDFDGAIFFNAVLDVDHVCLVEEIVNHRRYQVERPVHN